MPKVKEILDEKKAKKDSHGLLPIDHKYNAILDILHENGPSIGCIEKLKKARTELTEIIHELVSA